MRKLAKKPITIGMISSPWLGGSGVIAAELGKYLSKTGKYQIIFIGQQLPFRLSANEVKFHQILPLKHPLFKNSLDDISGVEGIVEAVIENKIDILHAHFAIPFGYYAISAKAILKQMGINIRVVTTLHGTDVLMLGKESPAVMKAVLKQSDEVTAVSKNLMNHAKKIYKVTKTIKVIYNFFDHQNLPNLKTDLKLLRKRFAKANQKILLHISNFRPIKKVEDVLKIFAKVNKKLPCVLIFIGDGPKVKLLKRVSNLMTAKNSIYFLKTINNPYQYLKMADGLIVTSEYESFGLVALEALSFGVPVFSTNVGGVKEVIKQKASGYLIKFGDINAFSKTILNHFSDSKKVEEMKINALNSSYLFSANKIIPQYEKIYQRLYNLKTPS